MKKILSIILMFLLISTAYNVYAANEGESEENIEFNMVGAQSIEIGTLQYEVTLSLGKFTNIVEGGVMGFEANLKYDENIFKEVLVEGKNGWQITCENGILLGLCDNGLPNKEIGKLTFTLKEGLEPTQNIEIKMENIVFTDDNIEITTQSSVKFDIKEKEQVKEPEEDPTIIPGENNPADSGNPAGEKDITIADKEIPKAGLQKTLMIALIVLIILAIVFKFKSRKIK